MRPRSPKLSSKVLTNTVQYLFFAPPNSLKNVFQPSGFPGSSVNISLFISLIVSYPFLASKKIHQHSLRPKKRHSQPTGNTKCHFDKLQPNCRKHFQTYPAKDIMAWQCFENLLFVCLCAYQSLSLPPLRFLP